MIKAKSKVLREGYIKGLKTAQRIINEMLNESEAPDLSDISDKAFDRVIEMYTAKHEAEMDYDFLEDEWINGEHGEIETYDIHAKRVGIETVEEFYKSLFSPKLTKQGERILKLAARG